MNISFLDRISFLQKYLLLQFVMVCKNLILHGLNYM